MSARSQGLGLYTAACAIVGVMVVIQLWLLGAAMEELFAGDARASVRAAIASALLFAANAGLLVYVLGFDRRMRRMGG